MKLNDLKAGCIRDALERGAGVPRERRPIHTGAEGYRSKWERYYADEVLTPRLRSGEIADWRYEAIKLKVGKGAWFKVDFVVRELDGRYTGLEVKGHRREAAIVRIKAAALLWPDWSFVLVTRGKGGGWTLTRV